uniref:Uncharacterized protein n=1 Tax=Micrurus corallinus TaxID=54390 RepID=A0A2D4FXG6_MICCO
MSGSFQTFGSEYQMESQFPFYFFSISAVGDDQCWNNCKMNWRPEYPTMIEEYSLGNNKITGLQFIYFLLSLLIFGLLIHNMAGKTNQRSIEHPPPPASLCSLRNRREARNKRSTWTNCFSV